jgi:hypothetical protein
MAISIPKRRLKFLIVFTKWACSSKVPWERLSRATFIPAMINFSIIAVELVAGPSVHTILVRLLCNLDRLIPYSCL